MRSLRAPIDIDVRKVLVLSLYPDGEITLFFDYGKESETSYLFEDTQAILTYFKASPVDNFKAEQALDYMQNFKFVAFHPASGKRVRINKPEEPLAKIL